MLKHRQERKACCWWPQWGISLGSYFCVFRQPDPLSLKHKSVAPAFSRECTRKSQAILLEQMKGQELALSGVTAALENIYPSFCLALSQSPSLGVLSLSYSLSAFPVFSVAWLIIPPSCLHLTLASWFFLTWLVQGYIHV